MARFVAQFRNYSTGVRAVRQPHLGPDGTMVPGLRELEATFVPQWATDSDVHEAQSRMSFRGLKETETGEPFGVAQRVSVWDSEMARLHFDFDDAEVDLITDTLRGSPFNGQDFIEVTAAAVGKPWNGYDDIATGERIVELAIAIDADLSAVLAYERENQARPDVEADILAAIAAQEESVVVSAG